MNQYESNIKKLYILQFFKGLHFIGGVLVPFFTLWAGLNLTQVFTLQAWFMICVFLFEIPTGTIADWLGRKVSINLATFIAIIAPLVYASYPSFFIFMIAELLWALASALFSGADDAIVYDSLKKIKKESQMKKLLPRIRSWHMLALMIAAPVGSIIAKVYGVRYTMILMAIPMVIAFLISLTLKEPPITKKSKNYLKILREGIRFFVKHKVLRILALDVVVVMSLSFMIIWLYQPMLMQLNLPIEYFGIVHAAIVISQIAVMNNYSGFENILKGKRKFIFFSAFIAGLMFIIGGLSNNLLIFIPAIILISAFGLSRKPLFSSYMNKYIPSDKRATVLSTVNMLEKLSAAILYPIVGFLADISLNYTFMILGIAIIAFTLISKVEESMLID